MTSLSITSHFYGLRKQDYIWHVLLLIYWFSAEVHWTVTYKLNIWLNWSTVSSCLWTFLTNITSRLKYQWGEISGFTTASSSYNFLWQFQWKDYFLQPSQFSVSTVQVLRWMYCWKWFKHNAQHKVSGLLFRATVFPGKAFSSHQAWKINLPHLGSLFEFNWNRCCCASPRATV